MRKVLLCLVVVVMVFSLTACSESITNLMGKMSSNVYGVEANTAAAPAATSSVDSAVSSDGTVTITAENAQSVVDSVLAVQGSATNTAALKEELTKASGTTGAALVSAISEITASTAVNEDVANAFNDLVSEYTSKMDSSEDYVPTKAEVATVMVIKSMAEAISTVKNEEELIEVGIKSVSALKVITQYGGVKLLEDKDLYELIPSSKGVDRVDVSDEEADQYVKIVGTAVAKVVKLITTDGKFVEAKFSALLRESKVMVGSYEMLYGKVKTADKLADIKGVGKEMAVNDMLLYLLGYILDSVNTSKVATLESFINKNYEILIDIQHKYDDLTDDDIDTLKDLVKLEGVDDKVILTCAAIISDTGYSSLYDLLDVTTLEELKEFINGDNF